MKNRCATADLPDVTNCLEELADSFIRAANKKPGICAGVLSLLFRFGFWRRYAQQQLKKFRRFILFWLGGWLVTGFRL
jgi:hypothetical protein